MGYGLSLPSSTRYEFLTNGGPTGGINPSNGTANTYGSLVSMGTTSFDYDGIMLSCVGDATGTTYRISITVNTSGTDEPLVTDYLFYGGAAVEMPWSVNIPVAVPKGATLKAKCIASGASGLWCSVAGYQGDARMLRGFRGATAATDYGASTLPSNGITLSGTTTTGWVQIQATSPNRFAGLSLSYSSANASTGALQYRFDIGWGSSGNERVFYSHYFRQQVYTPMPSSFFPCDFPAGTRFAARGLASGATTITWYLALQGLIA